jgi:hypothetical protein
MSASACWACSVAPTLTGGSSTRSPVGAGDGSDLISAAPATLGSVASAGVDASIGVAVTSKGVAGALFFVSFNRSASRFFSSVRRKTLIVVRRDLFGLQSSAATGVCSQTGQEDGRVDWPVEIVSKSRGRWELRRCLHVSHIACSQHGSRNALIASLLQIAHRSLIGISSWESELHGYQYDSYQTPLREQT